MTWELITLMSVVSHKYRSDGFFKSFNGSIVKLGYSNRNSNNKNRGIQINKFILSLNILFRSDHPYSIIRTDFQLLENNWTAGNIRSIRV